MLLAEVARCLQQLAFVHLGSTEICSRKARQAITLPPHSLHTCCITSSTSRRPGEGSGCKNNSKG